MIPPPEIVVPEEGADLILQKEEAEKFARDLKHDDETLMDSKDRISKDMLKHIRENKHDLEDMGIRRKHFNIDGILGKLTNELVKHSPRLHHHLGKIKKHLETLKSEHGIDNEHIDTIKGHVDTLHQHVGIIKGENGHEHVENLKNMAKALIDAHVAGGEGFESNETSEQQAEELVKNFRNKRETMGGLNAEEMMNLFRANNAENPKMASREQKKKLQDLMNQLREAET
jgi:hypothetical protein